MTPSELLFYPQDLNFGCCTTHESVLCTVTITNTSILPQSFGFIDTPPYVDIQPNDGFGELLPKESLKLDLLFSAKKPKDYEFDLVCKSGLDKLVGFVYRSYCSV